MSCFPAFFVVLGIIITVYLFRRQRNRQQDEDEKPADRDLDTGDDEKPYIGYRETILGIPKDERKQFRQKNSKSATGGTRRKDESRIGGPSTNSEPVEMAGDSTVPNLTNGQRITSRDRDFADGGDQVDGKLSSVSAMRIQNWLPELPAPALSRGSSTASLSSPPQSYYGGEKNATTTASLAEIHERLTKPDLDRRGSGGVGGGGGGNNDDDDDQTPESRARARAHVSLAEDSRWSATTHSSVFTTFSSRSSGAAYRSSLRPPPLRRLTHAMDPLRESSPEPAGGAGGASAVAVAVAGGGGGVGSGGPKTPVVPKIPGRAVSGEMMSGGVVSPPFEDARRSQGREAGAKEGSWPLMG